MSTSAAQKPGKVLVISGPSGVGKSTICHRLCASLPAEFSVSVTTRKPRPGEETARDYHYISHEQFAQMLDQGELLEWAGVYGQRYGTPKGPVQRAIAEGRIIILEIDIQGCIQVRKHVPEAITIFLLPPTLDEQRRRIEGRRTDSAEEIRLRLAKADGEIRYANETGCYAQFIINADLDETVEQIEKLVRER